MEKIKLLSLFSGIGAFEKALENLGIDYELVGFSEIDKYAIESYSAIHNVSTNLNLGDIAEIKNEDLPKADLVTYGFPCQDVSVAGKLKGIKEGTRSGLLYEAERVIEQTKPKYAIAENVKNLVGKRFKDDFEALLERLEGLGYNNYWKVLNAKDFNIPQNRERVFIVSIRKDIDTGHFEFPVGQDSKYLLKDFLEEKVDSKYNVSKEYEERFITNRLGNTSMHKRAISDGSYKVIGTTVKNDNRGANSRHWVYDVNSNISTIDATTYKQPKQILVLKDFLEEDVDNKYLIGEEQEEQLLYQDTLKINSEESLKLKENGNGELQGGKWDNMLESNRRVYNEDYVSPTITTCQGGNTEPKVLVNNATKKGYAVAKEGDSINLAFPQSKTRRGRVGKQVAQTLDTSCNQGVLSGWSIRKLTPKECWRLMGFNDRDYNVARNRLEEKFYNGRDRSNSQMYKQAGNSIVVNVLEEIFRKLLIKK